MSGSPSQMAQREAAKRLCEETTVGGYDSKTTPDMFSRIQDEDANKLTRAMMPGYTG